jgi:integrase
MAQNPSGALVVVPAKTGGGYYWEAKWRINGKQIKRRIGPAWVELRPEPADVDGWGGRFRKRRGIPQAGYLTPDDAAVEMRRAIKEHAEREARKAARGERVLFEEAASAWLTERQAESGWKPTTARNYRALLAHEEDVPKNHGRRPRARIMREFAGKDVRDITTKELRDFLRTLDKDPKLSARSTNAHRQVLSMIFKFAVAEGWREDDPTEGTSKRREADPAELIVYSPDQVQAIAREADAMHASLIVAAAFSGLRLGELLELRWRDVSFPSESIHVQRNYAAGLGVTTPKGRKGRSVPMSAQVSQVLATLGQREYKVRPGDLVFCREDGEHLDPTTVRQRYYDARDAAAKHDEDMPSLRFHDLRHTFGSLAAASGMDLVWIKQVMGHASITTTQRYLHARRSTDDAAKLSRAFAVASVEEAVPAAE